jgi:hypothetical protein
MRHFSPTSTVEFTEHSSNPRTIQERIHYGRVQNHIMTLYIGKAVALLVIYLINTCSCMTDAEDQHLGSLPFTDAVHDLD